MIELNDEQKWLYEQYVKEHPETVAREERKRRETERHKAWAKLKAEDPEYRARRAEYVREYRATHKDKQKEKTKNAWQRIKADPAKLAERNAYRRAKLQYMKENEPEKYAAYRAKRKAEGKAYRERQNTKEKVELRRQKARAYYLRTNGCWTDEKRNEYNRRHTALARARRERMTPEEMAEYKIRRAITCKKYRERKREEKKYEKYRVEFKN